MNHQRLIATIRKGNLILFFLAILVLPCSATWSIIMVDPVTKQIGIAGASCTYSVYGIGAIAPGKGAIIVQAMTNPMARARGLKMIMANAEPETILKAIMDPQFYPDDQQYAFITIDQPDGALTYTGKNADPHKGAMTGHGISVQGNTLATIEELNAAYDAALKARDENLPMEQALMAALEAGAALGGDKRCGDRKASSAFITVMKAGDNPREPYLNLVITGNSPNENAVERLTVLFKKWEASHAENAGPE